MLDLLGVCGMSDDETDEEPSPLKKVRRRELEWVSGDVARLLHTVDSYKVPHAFGLPRGNKAYPRILQSAAVDSVKMRQPVLGLPINYYNQGFLKRCGKADFLKLKLKKEIPIPELVSDLIVLWSIAPLTCFPLCEDRMPMR